MLGCSDGAKGGDGGAAGDGGSSQGGSGASSTGGTGAGPSDLEVRALNYTTEDLPLRVLDDGDPLELWRAPQGGHVILIGAQIKGLESDVIELRARLRVPTTNFVVAEESRTVVTQPVPGEPGWRQNDRRTNSQAAHVPVCPNYEARAVVDEEHVLEVEVTELYADFSFGSATVTVLPTCMQTHPSEKAQCVCECEADYTLGKCGATGPNDAGIKDGGNSAEAGRD